MGGQSKQTQETNQIVNRAPWAPAQGLLTGILGQAQPLAGQAGLNPTESAAFQGLQQNAQAGNPYANAIGGYATNLLGGGNAMAQAGRIGGAFDTLQGQLSPYASGANIGASNQQVQSLLDTLGSDISGRINAQYAGAGRDLSGLNAQNVSRGLAQGLAPVLLGQYNQDVQNQLGAAQGLYGAANTTGGLLSNLNQQQLANMGTGVDASTAALAARDSPYNQQLAIQQMMRGIPIQQLSQLAQLGVPIAGLGGTGTQQGNVTAAYNPSLQQNISGWLGIAGKAGQAAAMLGI